MDRIVLDKPLLDLFSLRGKYDPLPLHDASTFAVLSHDIHAFIQYFNEAVALGPSEMVRRQTGVMFLHLLLE